MIDSLVGLDDSWKKGDISKLYASSWAAIYFLMDTQAGRVLLKNIMLAEQESLCNKLSEKQLKTMMYKQFPNLNREYSQRLKKPLKAHIF